MTRLLRDPVWPLLASTMILTGCDSRSLASSSDAGCDAPSTPQITNDQGDREAGTCKGIVGTDAYDDASFPIGTVVVQPFCNGLYPGPAEETCVRLSSQLDAGTAWTFGL